MAKIEGVYIISVAARLLEMHPQTLRKYERIGLIEPSRTGGMLRLYSVEDLEQLRFIKHLVEDLGLNLAGVRLALRLARGLQRLRRLITEEEPRQVQELYREVEQMMRTIGLII